MDKEKLQTIRSINEPVIVKRVPQSEASGLVKTREWTYTSKGVYDKWVKNQKPKYTSGTPYAKINREANVNKNKTGNNRRNTNGRKYVHSKVDEAKPVKGIKVELGFDKHEAIKHVKSVDPITGKVLYSKEGKGITTESVITNTTTIVDSKKVPLINKHRTIRVLQSGALSKFIQNLNFSTSAIVRFFNRTRK